MAIEAALGHQGVAMGRLSLVEDLLTQGRLVAPFERLVKKIPTQYWLVYPNELADRPGVRAVIEWLHKEAESARAARGKLAGSAEPGSVEPSPTEPDEPNGEDPEG